MQYDVEDPKSVIQDRKFQFLICRPLIFDF